MNLFQWLALPVLALLLLGSLMRLARGGHPRGATLLSFAVWLAAALAIWRPDLTIALARLLGIGRGTDLVFYFVAIAFFVSVFYFYHQIVQLRSEITSIVRALALQEADKKISAPGKTAPAGARTAESGAGDAR